MATSRSKGNPFGEWDRDLPTIDWDKPSEDTSEDSKELTARLLDGIEMKLRLIKRSAKRHPSTTRILIQDYLDDHKQDLEDLWNSLQSL